MSEGADGRPDPAFGDGGVAQIPVAGGYVTPYRLRLLPDGALLLVATTQPDPPQQENALVVLWMSAQGTVGARRGELPPQRRLRVPLSLSLWPDGGGAVLVQETISSDIPYGATSAYYLWTLAPNGDTLAYRSLSAGTMPVPFVLGVSAVALPDGTVAVLGTAAGDRWLTETGSVEIPSGVVVLTFTRAGDLVSGYGDGGGATITLGSRDSRDPRDSLMGVAMVAGPDRALTIIAERGWFTAGTPEYSRAVRLLYQEFVLIHLAPGGRGPTTSASLHLLRPATPDCSFASSPQMIVNPDGQILGIFRLIKRAEPPFYREPEAVFVVPMSGEEVNNEAAGTVVHVDTAYRGVVGMDNSARLIIRQTSSTTPPHGPFNYAFVRQFR